MEAMAEVLLRAETEWLSFGNCRGKSQEGCKKLSFGGTEGSIPAIPWSGWVDRKGVFKSDRGGADIGRVVRVTGTRPFPNTGKNELVLAK